MPALQGSIDVNIEHIDKMITQISHLEDASCAQIHLVVNAAMNSIKGLMSGIIKEISALNPLTSLMNLPGPDPVSIVNWLKDLVTGLIGTQVKALITYTIKLIKISVKLGELIVAIQGILPKLAECALSAVDPSTILNDLKAELDDSIASSFSSITELTTNLSTISSTFTTSFDTSSPEAFLATAEEKYTALSAQLKSYSG